MKQYHDDVYILVIFVCVCVGGGGGGGGGGDGAEEKWSIHYISLLPC